MSVKQTYFHVLVIVFFHSDCHHFSWLPFYPLEMMSLVIYLSPQTTDALKNLTESMDPLLKRKKKKPVANRFFNDISGVDRLLKSVLEYSQGS